MGRGGYCSSGESVNTHNKHAPPTAKPSTDKTANNDTCLLVRVLLPRISDHALHTTSKCQIRQTIKVRLPLSVEGPCLRFNIIHAKSLFKGIHSLCLRKSLVIEGIVEAREGDQAG